MACRLGPGAKEGVIFSTIKIESRHRIPEPEVQMEAMDLSLDPDVIEVPPEPKPEPEVIDLVSDSDSDDDSEEEAPVPAPAQARGGAAVAPVTAPVPVKVEQEKAAEGANSVEGLELRRASSASLAGSEGITAPRPVEGGFHAGDEEGGDDSDLDSDSGLDMSPQRWGSSSAAVTMTMAMARMEVEMPSLEPVEEEEPISAPTPPPPVLVPQVEPLPPPPAPPQVDPELRSGGGGARKRKRATAEDYDNLEERFRRSGGVFLNGDFMELERITGMSQRWIRNWYKQRKAEVGTEDEIFNSMSSFLEPEPPDGAGACQNQGPSHEVREDEQRSPSNSVDGRPGEAAAEHGPEPEPERRHGRCLRCPAERTKDLAQVREDIRRVKYLSLEDFSSMLRSTWARKAERLFSLASAEGGRDSRRKLFRESRRLKEINCEVSCFSEEQEVEKERWRAEFVESKLRSEGRGRDAKRWEIEHKVKEVVLPWMEPFVYGRVTKQEGRWLSLSVALDDFCKVTEKIEWSEWDIPIYIQYDVGVPSSSSPTVPV